MLLIRQAGAIILHHHVEVIATAAHRNRDMSFLTSFETVFHRIGDQFGKHQRDSGVASCAGIMPNLPTKSTSMCWSCIVAKSTAILSRLEMTLLIVDDLIGGLAQSLMHHGDESARGAVLP